MKTALLQLCSSDSPRDNLTVTRARIQDAAAQGAKFILTPEVSNCVSSSREHQLAVLQDEGSDLTLAGLRAEAADLGVWLSIGSLALKTNDADGRFANRSLLINPKGEVVSRYDKIHMFDVDVSPTETYRESAGYRPGNQAVLAQTPIGNVGLSICYDLRFPHLYRALAQAGADILLVPSAFSVVTGAAHWQPLLQARAIETGCYVLAAAQTGTHSTSAGKPRETYGHTMAISPWGEVLAVSESEISTVMIDLNVKEVSHARKRIAALKHDRPFEGP